MRTEQLTKRVTIQQLDPTTSTTGDYATYSTLAIVWAEIEPLHGREYFATQQFEGEVTTRIRIRYKAGLRPNMRVLYGTRIYDIMSVIDYKELHHEIQLMCRELVE